MKSSTKTEPTNCKTCNAPKPVTGWKLHARFPDDVFCSRVCVDTAGAGSLPTEKASPPESAVAGPNPTTSPVAPVVTEHVPMKPRHDEVPPPEPTLPLFSKKHRSDHT